MNGGEKEVCLVLSNSNQFTQIRNQLKDNFVLKNVSCVEKVVSITRTKSVLCLITHINDKSGYSPLEISFFTQQFPTIPIIAIVDGTNFDLIFSCAKIGITEIVLDTELDKLKEKIMLIFNFQETQLMISELGIDVKNYSDRVKHTLDIIEKNYTKIKFVEEIADLRGVKLATLSREISKECKVHLLKYIYFLKFREAVYLMKNHGLRLKNIIEKTGFINNIQFNRWFTSFIGISPQEFREKKMEINFKSIFDEKVRIKS